MSKCWLIWVKKPPPCSTDVSLSGNKYYQYALRPMEHSLVRAGVVMWSPEDDLQYVIKICHITADFPN